jgi:hypothetical protein
MSIDLLIFCVTPDALFLLKNRYERVDRRLAASLTPGRLTLEFCFSSPSLLTDSKVGL